MSKFAVPFIVLFLAAVGIATCARADAPGPFDFIQAAFCPPPVLSLAERAPEAWFGPKPVYAPYEPDSQYGVIEYPANGHGDSGGHKPVDNVVPSPVPNNSSLTNLLGAIIGLAFVMLLRKAVL